MDEQLARERLQRGEPEGTESWSEGFWRQVRQICLEVIECAREGICTKGKLGMFEILGLDFICDAGGNAVFLEVNRDPSWVVDGDTKRGIIPALVAEMLKLVLSAHGDLNADPTPAQQEQSPSGHHFEVLLDEASSTTSS